MNNLPWHREKKICKRMKKSWLISGLLIVPKVWVCHGRCTSEKQMSLFTGMFQHKCQVMNLLLRTKIYCIQIRSSSAVKKISYVKPCQMSRDKNETQKHFLSYRPQVTLRIFIRFSPSPANNIEFCWTMLDWLCCYIMLPSENQVLFVLPCYLFL